MGLLLLVTLAICSILCRQTIAKMETIELREDRNQEQLFGPMLIDLDGDSGIVQKMLGIICRADVRSCLVSHECVSGKTFVMI